MDILVAPYQTRVLPADGRSDIGPWMSPLKLFEYMAASRAIVASDLPAIREVLQDGVTALLVSPDDLAAWRTALGRLKSAPLRRHLAANARRLVVGEYTWAARARKVLAGVTPP